MLRTLLWCLVKYKAILTSSLLSTFTTLIVSMSFSVLLPAAWTGALECASPVKWKIVNIASMAKSHEKHCGRLSFPHYKWRIELLGIFTANLTICHHNFWISLTKSARFVIILPWLIHVSMTPLIYHMINFKLLNELFYKERLAV